MATAPEPRSDVRAQFEALFDPKHPKRAVWVSYSNALALPLDGQDWVKPFHLPHVGTLYASKHDCARLAADPSEETLALILDYIEPKSMALAHPVLWLPVVQAEAFGGVVWEQIASWERVGEARDRAALYGRPVVLTMEEVLVRRHRLISAAEQEPHRERDKPDLRGCQDGEDQRVGHP